MRQLERENRERGKEIDRKIFRERERKREIAREREGERYRQ